MGYGIPEATIEIYSISENLDAYGYALVGEAVVSDTGNYYTTGWKIMGGAQPSYGGLAYRQIEPGKLPSDIKTDYHYD